MPSSIAATRSGHGPAQFRELPNLAAVVRNSTRVTHSRRPRRLAHEQRELALYDMPSRRLVTSEFTTISVIGVFASVSCDRKRSRWETCPSGYVGRVIQKTLEGCDRTSIE